MISLGPILCICPQHGWILYLCQLLCLACAACGGWWFRLTSRTGFVLILWLPHCEAGVGVWWVLTFLPFGIQLWIKRTASLSIINTLRLLESPRAYIWKWAYSQDPQHPEKYWVSGLVVGTGMKTVNWCFLFQPLSLNSVEKSGVGIGCLALRVWLGFCWQHEAALLPYVVPEVHSV